MVLLIDDNTHPCPNGHAVPYTLSHALFACSIDDMDQLPRGLNELLMEGMSLSGELGVLRAKINWLLCRDVNGKSKGYKFNSRKINDIKKKLKLIETNLSTMVDDIDLKLFRDECDSVCEETEEMHEYEISKNHMPLEFIFNKKALLNKTQCTIPDDIRLILSFGWKFLAPYIINDSNLYSIVAQIDHCITESVPELQQHEAFRESTKILSGSNMNQENDTLQWLSFASRRTEKFFRQNKHIFATRADKGAGTIVIYLKDYTDEIGHMLSDQTCYRQLSSDVNILGELINKETKLIKILANNYKCKKLIPNAYQPNILNLARFYGLPKIHKEGFKLRPIVSMKNAPGHALGCSFNEMLKTIFPVKAHHVRDSYDMKEFIDVALIRDNDILVSYDAEQMYTKIPRSLGKSLVMERHGDFHTQFGLGTVILERIVDFLLVDSVVFMALENCYTQVGGIPMGGTISPTIARIVMDRVIEHLFDICPYISFIKVFVDDTLVAIESGKEVEVLNTLNSFNESMNFTMELEEDGKQSINFLNLTVIRDGNFLISNWYRKPFASGRLVNYYSSHKKSIILGTAEGFIRTVLQLSDPRFFHENRIKVIQTLVDNSFPDTIIEVLLNKFYTYMKPGPEAKRALQTDLIDPSSLTQPGVLNTTNYKIFPHAICNARKIKRVVQTLKHKNITLADSTRNTKVNFVTTKKDIIPWAQKSNLILVSKCQCGLKHKAKATEFNQTGELLKRRMETTFDVCQNGLHAFKKMKVFGGLAYGSQTGFLLKYMKHRFYRSIVDNCDLPNYHFAKLIKKKYKTKK